ncbi:MAG TPA: DUF3667 domain-containing protein [Lacibacter sp.]|nr:DUF3667 domain-containing protein [Lacibacter sp.]
MQQPICLNCQAILKPHQKFCDQCGQKADTHRLSLSHIWHDLIHAFTHADKGFLHLIWQLAVNPGKVARAYINGQRKKYFNPFHFLILVVGVASLVLISTSFVNFSGNARIPANPVSAFLNKHVNLIILLNVPILALWNQLLFRKSHTNFAENLVLAAYASGERSVFFTLMVAPLWMFLHRFYYPILFIYIFSWFCYYGWACSGFFTGKRTVHFLKGFLVAVLTQLVTIVLVSGSIWIYFLFFHKN